MIISINHLVIVSIDKDFQKNNPSFTFKVLKYNTKEHYQKHKKSISRKREI